MYLLYSVLSVVALIVASPFLAYQAVRHRKYVRGLRPASATCAVVHIDGDERFGSTPCRGETLTARALIGELKARYPA